MIRAQTLDLFAQIGYPLHGTVFSFLYMVKNETVWIIDMHDQGGFRSADVLRQFAAELRARG